MRNDEQLSEVIARFNLAIRKQDWATMRACCHDEAIIDSVTAGEALGPSETVSAVRRAYRDGVYIVDEWEHEDLADGSVLSYGMVQYRGKAGGMSNARFHWLTTGRDGLMWRVKAFALRSQALEHLEQYGLTLGL